MKRGYTLIEGLVSMALISLIALCAIMFVSFYNKNVIIRNNQISTFTSGIDTIERLRVGIDTVEKLIDFMNDNAVKVYAVGFGEVTASGGALVVVNPERYGFNSSLTSVTPRIFRIEAAGGIPNSKVTTIIRI